MPSTRGVKIVSATESDLPLIMEFIREFAEYEKLMFEVTHTEEDLREGLFGEGCNAEVFLARLHGQAVGYAVVYPTYSTFNGKRGLHLEDIFVKPLWRGRGIGRALFMHCVELARERGCGRMDWLVLDWNETSVRFYESLGARALKDFTVYRLNEADLERLRPRASGENE